MTTDHEPEPGPELGPELVTIPLTATAVVRDVVPMAALRDFFDGSFRDLDRVLSAQGVAVAGPAFGRFRGPIGATVDVEVGFATDRTVQPNGAVVAGSLPGGRVARLVHAGAFDRLGSSWERLRTWIEGQGLSAADDRWEVYLTQPSPAADPSTLRTELNWPITG